ncbi:MAG TPA: hypothetical protein VH257_01150, partial [Chloroflexota bacterium]|nr:hypothetical protein [Chloroflexota bacterium]
GVTGTTTGRDMIPALVLMGAGMGLMMMSLNTHMLNAAPRDLTSRVTALSQSLNNVVSSLAIATFATILQARIAFHVTEAALLTGGQPGPQALAEASAMAFADVYRTALGVVLFAWLLAWTLRPLPAPGKPGKPEDGIAEGSRPDGTPEPATARASGVSGVSGVEREPVLVGH